MPRHRHARLRLRPWTEELRADFAAMNSDMEVMADVGGPLRREASDAKFDRYREAHEQLGFSRWAVIGQDGAFLGYVGVLPGQKGPLGPHHEISWRLIRHAWGQGYAPEAARAALSDIFDRVGLNEELAYTAASNARSKAVMEKLGLERKALLDFTNIYNGQTWNGLVWSACRPTT